MMTLWQTLFSIAGLSNFIILLLEDSEDSLPVLDFLLELKLTVGDIFSWLKL